VVLAPLGHHGARADLRLPARDRGELQRDRAAPDGRAPLLGAQRPDGLRRAAARAAHDAVSLMAAEPMIRIEGLRKSFGALECLKGIDLTVARGEVVCLIGPSGSR